MTSLPSIAIAQFKELLTRQLNELLDAADRTVNTMVQDGDRCADLLDQAAIESDRNYTLRIRDRESQLIRKIRTALEKIDDGTFGICEACGEDIALARLQARPVTSYCIRCKTQMEIFEKVSGF